MLTTTEERLIKYIEQCAKDNIRDKSYFRMTDVLQDAFLLTEDKAYDVFKNIIARKYIRNSKYDIVSEYIDMLKEGYDSIQDQVEAYGGDKFKRVVNTAEQRLKNYEGGTFFDVLRKVYRVSDEEIMPLVEKFLNYVTSPGFTIRLEKEIYHKFLQDDLEELEKQYQRFTNLNEE